MINIKDLVCIKELIAYEDVLFGYGVTKQIRDGELVDVTKINTHTIPYRTPCGELTTIGAVLDEYFRSKNGTT